MSTRIFPATPTARYFSLALLSDIAFEFGLCDALGESTASLSFFPPDTPAHQAYWEGHQVGVSLFYQLTGQRCFACTYEPLTEVNQENPIIEA